ncbi:MAG: flagellar protein FlaG [Planctomycetes bacterium]|nr:flagellar protein FlaG [Planctomycetota bacterium]
MTTDGLSTTRTAQPATFGELARILVSRPPSSPETSPAPAPQGGTVAGLQEAVQRANDAAAQQSVSLRFGIHQSSGEFYVRVLDGQSGDVIKTIPPQKLLDFRGAFAHSLGLLFDGTA